MGQVGKLSKVRFYAEDSYGGGKGVAATASDHACDTYSGPGPDRELLDHDKIAGAYGTRYAQYGKKAFSRTFEMEINDDNDQWLEDACITRTANVQTSYEIYLFEAGGQEYKARGCKANSLTVSWEDGGEWIASAEFIGDGNIQSIAVGDSLITTFTPETYMTNTPYMQTALAGVLAGLDVTSVTATINDNLFLGPMNATMFSKSLSEGPQDYELSVTVFNPNATTFLDSMNSGSLCTATVTGSDGTNSFTMTFSNCILQSPQPETINPGDIVETTVKLTPTSASQFSWVTA